MTLTNAIVEMNNHAVELLRRGRYNGAMLDLRKVVLVLAEASYRNDGFFLQESQLHVYPTTSSKKIAATTSLQPLQQDPWDIFVTTSPTAFSVKGLRADSVGVISIEYPFLLNLPLGCSGGHCSSTHHDNHQLSDDENGACTCVCIYNMAMCCYCEWLHNQNDNDLDLLQHALDLYDQALGIIISWKPILAGSSFSLLIMALCKYITTIFHDVGDLVRVQSWRDTLERAIGFVDHLNLADNDSYRLLIKSTVLSRVQATLTVAGAA